MGSPNVVHLYSIEKLSATLHDAQVDLNPHQIGGSFICFSVSAFQGAILADEIWVAGKQLAGIVIAQNGRKERKILIIVPSNLESNGIRNYWKRFSPFGRLSYSTQPMPDPESRKSIKMVGKAHRNKKRSPDRKQQICGRRRVDYFRGWSDNYDCDRSGGWRN